MGTLLILGPCCLWALPSVVYGLASPARIGWVCAWGPSEGTDSSRPRLSSVSSRPLPCPATCLLPSMVFFSSTNFKRPSVLISAGALPPSQEGRAITELANYMLELGFCFIQALALCTFWSKPGKTALADQAIPSQGLQNVMGKCCVPFDLRAAQPRLRTKMRIVHLPLCLSLSGVNAKLKGYIFNACSRLPTVFGFEYSALKVLKV